jgi:hypothetical protein
VGNVVNIGISKNPARGPFPYMSTSDCARLIDFWSVSIRVISVQLKVTDVVKKGKYDIICRVGCLCTRGDITNTVQYIQ